MKFQPGQVVHLIDRTRIRSTRVNEVWTELDGASLYEIHNSIRLFQADELFATFDNAMAELQRKTKLNP